MTPRRVLDTLLLLGFEPERNQPGMWRHKLTHGTVTEQLVVFVYPNDNGGAGDFSIHAPGRTNPRFSDGRSFMDEVVRRLEGSANGQN